MLWEVWRIEASLKMLVPEVKNFGKGETTVVSGSKSYQSAWYNSTWQDALAFNPDQVLLMFLGETILQL